MRNFERRQPQSLSFGLFLAVVGALLLPAALAPRANADPTDYWDSEDPLGSRPRPAPELLSQPPGVLINQPLASNYNPTLAINVAPGDQPGGFQPLQVDANFSWTGTTAAGWNSPGNWSPSGPPGVGDAALFDGPFINQPNLTTGATVGTLHMATGVIQNVTLSANPGATLNISALGIPGTGILVDNTNAFTLTISADLGINNNQAWTNNSGNLFTVSGNVSLSGNALTVNGTGNTLISGVIAGIPAGSTLTKDGSGTLTLTGTNIYTRGTTVSGGTLLVNNTAGSGTGTGSVTVSNAGSTLGGTGTMTGAVTANAGANIAPGNGGNNTAILTTGALTLAATSNFRVDINGTTAGTGYDQINVATGGVTITNSVLVVTVGTTLSLGQTFTILNKVSLGAITGTFAGVPQGGTVVGSNGTVFQVSYTGGTGNDIVLTVVQVAPVSEPSTWMGGALAIAGLAFTQRRRLRKLIARRCAVGS
jgi:autotransporter-associated beta strand protein